MGDLIVNWGKSDWNVCFNFIFNLGFYLFDDFANALVHVLFDNFGDIGLDDSEESVDVNVLLAHKNNINNWDVRNEYLI